jgi:hypothetical protein
VNALKDSNSLVTQMAVAKLAGLTRQTTAKYLPEVLKDTTTIVPLKELFQAKQKVNLGVHQIDSDSVNNAIESCSHLGGEDQQSLNLEDKDCTDDTS